MRVADRRNLYGLRQNTAAPVPRGALLLVMLVLLLTTAGLGYGNGLGAFDRFLTDFFASSHERPASDDIVIVAIDDKSLAQIGAWPWPRELHAVLLERINQDMPRAIGLDVILSESVPGRADEVLAAGLARSANVVLPVVLAPGEDGTIAAHLPTPALAANARALGTINLVTDRDGLVRSLPPQTMVRNQTWPTLAQAMLAIGLEGTTLPAMPAVSARQIAPQGTRIAFTGPPGSFLSVSYVDVLQGRLAPGTLQGKWVLVGATVPGMGHAHLTPVGGNAVMMPGVEIMANVLDGSLTGVLLRTLDPVLNALANVLILVVSLLVMAWAGEALAIWLLPAWLLLACGLSFALSLWSGLLLAPAAALLASAVAYLIWTWDSLRTMVMYLLEQSLRINRVPRKALPVAPNSGFQWLSGDRADHAIRSLGRAVDQLRDLYQFVEDALASLPDATLVIDAQAVVQVVNVAARTRFESDWSTLQGLPLAKVMARIHPIGGEKIGLEATSLRASTVTRWEATDEFDARLLVKLTPFKSAGGPNNGWIVSISDITDLREAERAREEILQFISHDMRSPQASIMTMIDLHRLDGGGPLDADKLDQIEQHVQRSLDMCTSYVQLSQAREADYELQDDVDLRDLISVCIDEMQVLARPGGVVLQALWQREPVSQIEGDSLLLGRALVNLLSNAIKFSPPGGTVTVRLLDQPDVWRIEVQDQGPGIAPDLQGQLFQRFHTLRLAENARHGAIGLGLELVRVVVERHRGRVGLHSTPGQGACFFIVLPRLGAHAGMPPPGPGANC